MARSPPDNPACRHRDVISRWRVAFAFAKFKVYFFQVFASTVRFLDADVKLAIAHPQRRKINVIYVIDRAAHEMSERHVLLALQMRAHLLVNTHALHAEHLHFRMFLQQSTSDSAG